MSATLKQGWKHDSKRTSSYRIADGSGACYANPATQGTLVRSAESRRSWYLPKASRVTYMHPHPVRALAEVLLYLNPSSNTCRRFEA